MDSPLNILEIHWTFVRKIFKNAIAIDFFRPELSLIFRPDSSEIVKNLKFYIFENLRKLSWVTDCKSRQYSKTASHINFLLQSAQEWIKISGEDSKSDSFLVTDIQD